MPCGSTLLRLILVRPLPGVHFRLHFIHPRLHLVIWKSTAHCSSLRRSRPLPDALDPSLHTWELAQIDVHCRSSPSPGITGHIGDGVLIACQPVRLGQSNLEYRDQSLGLIDVPLDPVCGIHRCEHTEVVGLP